MRFVRVNVPHAGVRLAWIAVIVVGVSARSSRQSGLAKLFKGLMNPAVSFPLPLALQRMMKPSPKVHEFTAAEMLDPSWTSFQDPSFDLSPAASSNPEPATWGPPPSLTPWPASSLATSAAYSGLPLLRPHASTPTVADATFSRAGSAGTAGGLIGVDALNGIPTGLTGYPAGTAAFGVGADNGGLTGSINSGAVVSRSGRGGAVGLNAGLGGSSGGADRGFNMRLSDVGVGAGSGSGDATGFSGDPIAELLLQNTLETATGAGGPGGTADLSELSALSESFQVRAKSAS